MLVLFNARMKCSQLAVALWRFSPGGETHPVEPSTPKVFPEARLGLIACREEASNALAHFDRATSKWGLIGQLLQGL